MSHIIKDDDVTTLRMHLKNAVISLAQAVTGAESKRLVFTAAGKYEVRVVDWTKRGKLVARLAYKGTSLRLAIKAYNAINI